MLSENPNTPNVEKYGIFPLSEQDRGAFVAHMLRLDQSARRLRFGANISDEAVQRLSERLPLTGVAWGLYIWGQLKGACLVLPYDSGAQEGELAITLAGSLRGRGWGRMLTQLALEATTCDQVDIYFVADNAAMKRICAQFPGPLTREGSDFLKTVNVSKWQEQRIRENGLCMAELTQLD